MNTNPTSDPFYLTIVVFFIAFLCTVLLVMPWYLGRYKKAKITTQPNTMDECATIRPWIGVNPHRFVYLLEKFKARGVERNETNITFQEIRGWGFSDQEIIPYLLLATQAGFLIQQVQVRTEFLGDNSLRALQDWDRKKSLTEFKDDDIVITYRLTPLLLGI